jgi:hypothetical protein
LLWVPESSVADGWDAGGDELIVVGVGNAAGPEAPCGEHKCLAELLSCSGTRRSVMLSFSDVTGYVSIGCWLGAQFPCVFIDASL